jgi:aminopeptidase N
LLEYFWKTIGPFEYEKLAHIQSSTMFGGMENASAIFYDEKAIAGGENIEHTVAHETAHQWFGDSVTERDWPDLWLSEGFATYFAALFYQRADGEATFRTIMEASRQVYVKSPAVARPVVDPAARDLLALLNPNNYQKGSWILHMLRTLVGDRAFFRGVRAYYQRHRDGNATTADFRAAIEASSRRRLDWFFRQWLYEPGYPQLRSASEWSQERREVSLTIAQVQPDAWPTFRLPLVIQMSGPDARRYSVELTARKQVFRFKMRHAPARIEIDPDGDLLKRLEP